MLVERIVGTNLRNDWKECMFGYPCFVEIILYIVLFDR